MGAEEAAAQGSSSAAASPSPRSRSHSQRIAALKAMRKGSSSTANPPAEVLGMGERSPRSSPPSRSDSAPKVQDDVAR